MADKKKDTKPQRKRNSPEPWSIVYGHVFCGLDEIGKFKYERDSRRAVNCVNACEGYEAAIVRKAIQALKLVPTVLEAHSDMQRNFMGVIEKILEKIDRKAVQSEQ